MRAHKRFERKKNNKNAHFARVNHYGEDDCEVMLINETNNVEEFRKRKCFWQHEVDTFQPNGLNKREMALFSYLNKSFFFIILTHNICFDTCHMARLFLYIFLKDFALSNLFNLPTYFIHFVYYNFFLFYSCCFYLFIYLFITIMST